MFREKRFAFLELCEEMEEDGGADEFQLGWMLLRGVMTETDVNEAYSHFETSAKKGHMGAMFLLGHCLLTGKHFQAKNEELGIKVMHLNIYVLYTIYKCILCICIYIY